jgi:hypothetical protein
VTTTYAVVRTFSQAGKLLEQYTSIIIPFFALLVKSRNKKINLDIQSNRLNRDGEGIHEGRIHAP